MRSQKIINQVRKSNLLNAITFYKSAIKLKIFSKLITEIRNNPKQSIYKIEVKTLMEEINFKNKSYSQLKKIAGDMFGKVVTKYDKGVRFDVLFTGIDINEAGYIAFKVNEDIRPHIVEVSKEYTDYFLEDIAELESYYSIRIYELLSQFKKPGKWFVTLEQIRAYLEIDPSQYKLYGHFKSKVILVAQRELEKYT